MYNEKIFDEYSKAILLNQNQSSKIKLVMFSIIAAVFMLFGWLFLTVGPSPDDYIKNGEYEFFFRENLKETETYYSRVFRKKTKTYYVPKYIGFVGDDSYTYEYHTHLSSEKKAQEFANENQTLLVSTYFNEQNEIFLLASDITLEEYFNRNALIGYILLGSGGILFVIGLWEFFQKKEN